MIQPANPVEYRFQDRESLTTALTRELSEIISLAQKERAQTCLALSGGSTPLPVYRCLASEDRNWSDVRFVLVDERWVNMNHAASNERALRDALAPALAKGAILTGMKTEHTHAAEGQICCEQRYLSLPLPFDCVILGMGIDGHTASLFPHAEGLTDALDKTRPALCTAINALQSEVSGENTERMSLTVAGILNSSRIILMITGDRKWSVYQRALSADDAQEIPVSALIQQDKTEFEIWWAP